MMRPTGRQLRLAEVAAVLSLVAAQGCLDAPAPQARPAPTTPPTTAASAAPPKEREPFKPARTTKVFRHDTTGSSLSPDGPTALDGKTLEEVLAYRKARVAERADLSIFPSPYDPLDAGSRRIYESITPKKRWLGPTAYYVANPYVLVVLTNANHVTPLNLRCPDVAFRYVNGRIEETRKGQAARCWLNAADADTAGVLRVVIVNAYDAGFHYAHVDLAESVNVERETDPKNIVNGLFEQSSFFHVGRYAANNISPEDRNGWIRLKSHGQQTRLSVKLWARRPNSVGDPADMTYVVAVDMTAT